MHVKQSIIVIVTTSLSCALPNLALACAVCGSQEEKAAGAYLAMTIVLSLLPLSLIGGVGYWIWKRAKEVAPCEPIAPKSDWKDLVLSPKAKNESLNLHNRDAGCTS